MPIVLPFRKSNSSDSSLWTVARYSSVMKSTGLQSELRGSQLFPVGSVRLTLSTPCWVYGSQRREPLFAARKVV